MNARSTSSGQAIADAARAAVGVRFRLHGRHVEHGLDCVGLAALALRAGGFGGEVPTGYRLRDGGDVAARLDAALARVDAAAPGDLILMRAGPGQPHLGIVTDTGFVHADAGLRRVAERPGAPPWPVLGIWRAPVCQASAHAEAPHRPSPAPDHP